MARIDSKGNLINDNVSTYTTIDSQGNLQFNPIPTPKKKKKNENTWFDTGALSDGYDFGDVTKTILGTAGDIGSSVLKGVSDTGLGIAKAGVGGIAMASEALGNKEYAEKLRNRLAGKDEEVNKRLEAIDVFGNASKALTDSSVLGNTTESILSGVGNYAGMAAAQSVGIPWQLTAGLSSAGAGLEEAYKNGASDKEAWISATVDAGAEILSEYIFGGLKLPGTGKTTEKMLGGLTKKISNKVIRGITEFGINATGEGLEEIISGQISAIGKKLTYMTDKELNEIYSNEDKFNDFIAGALSTVVANGVNPNTYRNVKAGRSLITNYTNNEQDLIDNLVDKIASESGQKKSKVEESVKEDLENGEISLDDIEKSLGGDRYTQYQAELQKENTINEEIKKLEDMKAADITVKQQEELKSLREQLEEQTKKVKDLGKDLTNYVYQNTQNDELIQRSYNEYFKKGQKYEIDPNKKYSKKQMEQIQKAMDSGLINNTRQMHLLMDNIAQIHEDKNITFNFMNSEQAKEHLIQKQIERYMKNNGLTELSEEQRNALYKQYQEDFKNRVVNGFVENGEVFLNVDSPKYLNAVMGHEITHLFEGDSKLYKNLRKEVLEFAKTKEEYKSRIEQLGENYKEIDSDLETELVNDIIGDYLFTDEEFVRKLSKNKNIFQKIYDEIKYLAKVITGRKEQAQLQKVKNMFDKVYKEIDINQNSGKYSITGVKSIDKTIKRDNLSSEQKQFLNRIKNNYESALQQVGKMANEEIRKKYGWFKDKNGDWKFEFTDKYSDLKFKPEKNGTYKLGDFLDHKLLYDIDPKLKDLTIKFKDLKGYNGVYHDLAPIRHITINNSLISKGKAAVKSTLLHEIQHYSQARNNFETGAFSGKTIKDMIDYVNSLGEIEAKDIQQRIDMTQKELQNIAPESSKTNPVHPFRNDLIQKRITQLANKKNNKYNNKKGRGIFDEETAQDLQEDTNENSNIFQRNGVEELDNSSFSYDNQGRKLSKQQQEYFKDSKVRDKNGNLMEVYHGTSEDFNVYDSKFLGENGLNYGIGFYLTNDIEEANKYAKNGTLKKQYVNIENPINLKKKTITENEIKNIVTELNNKYNYYKNNTELLNAISQINNLENNDYILSQIKDRFTYPSYELDDLSTRYADIMNSITNNTKYDGIIVKNPYEKGKNIYIAFESKQIKNIDNTNPTTNEDIRYSISDKTKDNKLKEILHDVRNNHDDAFLNRLREEIAKKKPEFFNSKTNDMGVKLTKEQQKYFNDSKARGINDSLTTVFHTTTDEVPQFNEFNPVGTQYYRFGDQVVNYYTDSKEMSGSYASQDYKMADTKKLNNVEELEKYLKHIGNLTGNDYKFSKINSIYGVTQDKQISKEAREFIKTLSESEKKQMLNNIWEEPDDSPLKGSNYDRVFSWNNFDKELQKKYHKLTDKYIGTADTVAIQQEVMKYLESPVFMHEDERLGGEIVGTYDSEEEMLKNIKTDLQKQDWSKNSKLQYEGYVNITNPYIVDAEKRNWNQVISQSNDFIDELDERVPQDIKDNLTRLYQESANKSAEAREKYNIIDQVINNGISAYESAVDKDIQKVNEIIKRVGFNEIEDLLNDTQMGLMGVNGWYNLAGALKEQSVIGDSTLKLIIDDFILPNDIKEWIKENYNKEIPIHQIQTNDVLKLVNQLGRKTTLKDIYQKNQENYLEFDKYRMPNSYFLESISSDSDNPIHTDMGYDLNDMFETRAEIFGPEQVAEEIAQAASVGFSKPELIRLWGTSKTTNDVVKEIIASNKDGNTNYDGVIFQNVVDYGGRSQNIEPQNVYVTFNSNQFKAVDNLTPTSDSDIRYSISENDNKGRTLSNQQRRFFNNSKLVDNNSELKVMYNGGGDYTTFDNTKMSDQSKWGKGIYLTESKDIANMYGDNVKEVYANITSPINQNEKTIPFEKYNEFIKALYDEDAYIEEYDMYDNDLNLLWDATNKGNWADYGEQLRNIVGVDGLIINDDNPAEQMAIAFNSNQIKNVDNLNPTDKEDIRMSISNKNEDIAPIGNYRIKGEDIKLQDIAPIRPTDNATEKNKVKQNLPIEPTREEAYENKKTRSEVREKLGEEMGITVDDLEVGKDISSLGYQRTDPIRLNEKVFGAEIGKKINDATIRKTNHNEAERTRFLNKEREEIANLGIKARSKESAAVQKYGEKQYINDKGELLPYGDVELAREFSDTATQDKIKNAARVLRNKYDVYIDEINKVITDMGYDPIPKRPDYMRHFQEINDKLSEWGVPLNRDSLSKDTLPTDINGITDQFKPGKNWFASAMQRKGLKTTYDAITGIDGYLEGASNLIYHTGDIQRYRTLSKMIRDTYGQSHGLDNVDLDTKEGQQRLNDIMDNKLSKYAAWLDEQANALAGKKGGIDRAAERILGRKIYTIADTAKKQVGSNMTGFNVRSALTNFASAVQGASKTNKLAFLKGTISTIKNMINNDDLIDKSDFLTNRFGSDTLSKKLWQKASNAGQILMTGSDYFTANQIWRSKYYENLSKGMNETEAIKNADDFASRIMGDRSKGMTAELFNSKTLGLLTQFQLEVNNQWSSIVHDNKMDVQRGNKSGATVLFQLGQLAAMSYMFNNFMKSMTGSDVMLDPLDILKELFGWNDDEDEETSLEERSQKVLENIVNNLPFANFITGGRIPISEAFTGAETAFKKLTGQKDKFGNEIKWEDVKDDVISSGAYWLLPTGYGQIRKTTKGMSMYDEELPLPGSYTNSGNLRFTAADTTGGKIKAALFGEYSSKEAQEYRESGYETINAKNIDLLKELGMNSTEFRKFEDKKDAATGTTLNKDGVKYTKYTDDNNNTYWYNKNTKELYDDNFNKSNKNVTELNKVSSNELLFDYISNSYFSEKQKQALFKNYFTNTTTDQYGYEKYQDSDKKTYWYDKDKNVLYDSKYNKVSTSKLSSLNKVSSSKDMSNYKNYNSYEEADYAIKNPEKYAASKLITNSYSNYKKYTDDISKIESDKDASGKTISNSKKKKVFEYINNLNEDYMSKIILFKMYYPSDKTYNTEIFNYLNNSTNLTLDEKKKVLKGLGATITEQGTVRW